jgi:hypothetical protein
MKPKKALAEAFYFASQLHMMDESDLDLSTCSIRTDQYT